MKIGVISDTHGYLDPRIPPLFQGVDHILHGGDIGPLKIVSDLERLAPVTAVLGNTDALTGFRETETVRVGELEFLIHHIVDPHALSEDFQQRLDRQRPHAVIFGHTHRPFHEVIGNILFFNPGYAGKQRFALPRTVGILKCEGGQITPEIIAL